MDFVYEPSKRIPIIAETDVVVIGGGPGGFPAAVAAARNNAHVLIIERYGFLGGLATAGLMGPIFGFAPIGCEHPILGGIPIEVIRRLQEIGAAPDDEYINWDAIRFDPELLKHVIDRLLQEAKVQILLHSLAGGVTINDDRIEAVVIESKSGRAAIKGKVFVDATGDGDIAYRSGCPYTKGRPADKLTQSMGTKFRIGGVQPMTDREEEYYAELVKKAIDEKRIPAYHAFYKEVSENGVTLRNNEVTPTVTRCPGDGTNVFDLTRAELKIREDSLKILHFYRKNVKGYSSCYLIDTPTQVGVRETRQITGDYVLTGYDVLEGRKFSDKIAHGCWFIDIHCPLGRYNSKSNLCSKECKIKPPCIMQTKYSDQLYPTLNPPKGSYYDIPYRCIVPKKINNLLISGRPISADHGGMASTRVIGTCMAIGQAAGVAAALMVKQKVTSRKLDYLLLRETLLKDGVLL